MQAAPKLLRTPRATLPTGLAGKSSPVAAAVEAATGLRPHFCPGRARVARREKNLAGGGKKDINTGPRRHPFSPKIIVRVTPTPMNGH